MKVGQLTELTAVLLLILMVLAGIFFVNPLRQEVSELSVQIENQSNELASLTTELDELKTLADQVTEDSAASEALLTAVPVGYQQDELVIELNEMAEEVGFTFNNISFSDSTTEVGSSLTVMASFVGDFEELTDFLQAIESANRLMEVSSLSVQRTEGDGIVFNVHIEAYYQ